MRQVLSQFPFTTLVLVGQLMFFTIFVGAIFWVFRKGSKEAYGYLSEIPFRKGGRDE